MEIFCETLSRFIELKRKTIFKGESIVLQSSTMKSMDLYKNLLNNSRKPESILQKIYNYVICKKIFLILFPVSLLLVVADRVLHGAWMNLDSAYCLIAAIFYGYLTIMNPYNDWIYIWRLKLYLWFRKIPQYSNGMANPRCITIHWDAHRGPTGQEQQRITENIIREMENELRIYDFGELESTLEAIQDSLASKRSAFFKITIKRCSYLLFFLSVLSILCYKFPPMSIPTAFGAFLLIVIYILRHALDVFFEKLQSWLVFLIVIIGLPPMFIVLYNKRIDLFIYYLILIVLVIYILSRTNKKQSSGSNNNKKFENNTKKYFQTLDIICRAHKAISKESLSFMIVTNDFNVLKKIPDEYQGYFKFVILARNDLVLPETFNNVFDLREISKIELPPMPMFPQVEIDLTNWVEAALRCVTEHTSQFAADGLKFLSLLIKINNGVLSNNVILSVVRPQLTKLALNYRNEISLQNQSDLNLVKEFFRYLEKFRIIHTSREIDR